MEPYELPEPVSEIEEYYCTACGGVGYGEDSFRCSKCSGSGLENKRLEAIGIFPKEGFPANPRPFPPAFPGDTPNESNL